MPLPCARVQLQPSGRECRRSRPRSARREAGPGRHAADIKHRPHAQQSGRPCICRVLPTFYSSQSPTAPAARARTHVHTAAKRERERCDPILGSCVHKLYVGSCFYFTARLALEPQPSVKVPWAACAVPGAPRSRLHRRRLTGLPDAGRGRAGRTARLARAFTILPAPRTAANRQ